MREKKRMRIRADYILDRHEAAAEDEADNGPARKLCERADKAKYYISVLDSELNLIDELVSGAWHYEGASKEYPEDTKLKTFEKTATAIRKRWESGFYKRRRESIFKNKEIVCATE